KNCGYVKDSTTIHAYQAYTVNGKTVYGYYDRSAGAEILSLTNAYRRSNGRSSLSDNPGWQEYADIRAREQALDYSHTRPNGEKWYTLLPNVLRAENLAESKTTNPTGIMAAWKNSSGHNANLLNQDFNRLAVGCFHVMVFTGGSKIPSETVYWVQLFSRQ
ncbi:MAG: hypothetical protein IJP92_03565, partial [Lachnospiraceae bacterium]|nr:hypothetical protein [Lachnospiraceae bacterium]